MSKFVGNKDIDRKIINELPTLKDVISICLSTNYLKSLCNSMSLNFLFTLKESEKFIDKYKPKSLQWRDYVRSLKSMLEKDPKTEFVKAVRTNRPDLVYILLTKKGDELDREWETARSKIDLVFKLPDKSGEGWESEIHVLGNSILSYGAPFDTSIFQLNKNSRAFQIIMDKGYLPTNVSVKKKYINLDLN